MSPDARRAVGTLGERYAAAHLERAGYRVVERNFRTRAGELDLVLRGRGCIVFCEVRARVGTPAARCRGGPPGPLDSIGYDKRRRLRLMAREWLALRGGAAAGEGELRFDAIGVTLDSQGSLLSLEHVEDAF
jgi:putative endonuclease